MNKLMSLNDAMKIARAVRAAVESIKGVDVADVHIEASVDDDGDGTANAKR